MAVAINMDLNEITLFDSNTRENGPSIESAYTQVDMEGHITRAKAGLAKSNTKPLKEIHKDYSDQAYSELICKPDGKETLRKLRRVCPLCGDGIVTGTIPFGGLVTCPACKCEWCFHCRQNPHVGQTCWQHISQGFTSKPNSVPVQLRNQQEVECQICLESKLTAISACCNMKFCLSCLNIYISSKIDEGKVNIQCPSHSCSVHLDMTLIKNIISPDKFERLNYLLIKSGRYPDKKCCPYCDHIHTLDTKCMKIKAKIDCLHCGKPWCFSCEVPWHDKKTCSKYRKYKTRTSVKRWARNKTESGRRAQKCPGCGIWIEKIAGCDMMTCQHCGTQFNYKTGSRYPSHHRNRCTLPSCFKKILFIFIIVIFGVGRPLLGFALGFAKIGPWWSILSMYFISFLGMCCVLLLYK